MFQRLNGLEAATVGAEELTPEEVPFLRFDAAGQERFDGVPSCAMAGWP